MSDLSRLDAQMAFLTEACRLKSVIRANTLCDGSRYENSAEHSWHLALYALILGEHSPDGVDPARVIRMLILHDLVEIDVGDVPLHSGNGAAHGAPEIKAAEAAAAQARQRHLTHRHRQPKAPAATPTRAGLRHNSLPQAL